MMKQMIKLIINRVKPLAFLWLALPLSTYAETLHNVIEFSSEVRQEIASDLREVRLFTQIEHKKPEPSNSQVQQKLAHAVELVKANPAIEISENQRATYVRYDEQGQQRGWIEKGWMTVKSRDFAALSQFIAQLNGVLAIESIRDSLAPETLAKLENQMLEQSLEKFTQKAVLIQQTLNAKDYRIIALNLSHSPQHSFSESRMATSYRSAPNASEQDEFYSDSKQTIRATVNAKIELIIQ